MSAGTEFRSDLAAEKLTALATPTARLLLGASAVMAAVSSLANLAALDDITTVDSIEMVMHASTVATLVFAVLAGLHSATTDHRFGVIDQRLLSDPNRRRVLRSKLAAVSMIGLLYGALGAVTALAATGGFFAIAGETFDPTSASVVRALVGILVAAPIFAAIGAAVGMAVRSQPAAIGASLAWLLIVEPTVLVGLPSVGAWLPGASGLAVTNSPDSSLLGQGPGLLLLLGYAAVTIVLATFVFERADV